MGISRGGNLFLAATLAFLLFGSQAGAQTVAVPVASGGKAQAVIVLSGSAGEGAKFAASQLQKYLRALSGAEISSVSDAKIPAGAQSLILIGGPGQNRLVKRALGSKAQEFSSLKPEGFVLKTIRFGGRPVVVAGGNDDAGTMYAVFDLVQRLGVTFLLTGDVVPPAQSSLEIPALDVSLSPALKQRGILIELSHHSSATSLGYDDYVRMLDQMAKMKQNYVRLWWFAYSPYVKFSYRGETKMIGDISTNASAYLNSLYTEGGSGTTDDVTIGKQWFPRSRIIPPEMENVQTPEEGFAAAQSLIQKVIHYAKSRDIQVWLVDEMSALPPNLARLGERIGPLPFEQVFGTFMDPLDRTNREMQVAQLKALVDTYPEATGYFLNFSEMYEPQNISGHHDFYAAQEPKFEEMKKLMAPFPPDPLRASEQMHIDSNIAYWDLFQYLLAKKAEIAPNAKFGMMGVGRAYMMPFFDKMAPKDIPFANWEGFGPDPMFYYSGMGDRDRILTNYIDHDGEMLGMQFNVGSYIDHYRIFSDGVKDGLTGIAAWVVQPRGSEQNSSFLAEAAWNPKLTQEEFYKDFSERLFGADAAPDMDQAFQTLEAHQKYVDEDVRKGGHRSPGVLGCCGLTSQVGVVHHVSLGPNPYDGIKDPRWTRMIDAMPGEIDVYQHEIPMFEKALDSMHAAEPKVAPRGKEELAYLICRTEAYRDAIKANITERQAFMAFDQAFKTRSAVSQQQFEQNLDSSMRLFETAVDQAKAATSKYTEIVDYPSDLENVYRLNTSVILAFDLNAQWIRNIVDFNEGKPYDRHVPWEKLFSVEVYISPWH
ncbi:MAG: alpha-glucuronidase family glycosyl hydrolase [Terracidiphilus sp.]|jgi:hypothetical protein